MEIIRQLLHIAICTAIAYMLKTYDGENLSHQSRPSSKPIYRSLVSTDIVYKKQL